MASGGLEGAGPDPGAGPWRHLCAPQVQENRRLPGNLIRVLLSGFCSAPRFLTQGVAVLGLVTPGAGTLGLKRVDDACRDPRGFLS